MPFRREGRLMSACISDLPSARSCSVTILKKGGVLTPCDPILNIRNALLADWHLIGSFLQGYQQPQSTYPALLVCLSSFSNIPTRLI